MTVMLLPVDTNSAGSGKGAATGATGGGSHTARAAAAA